MNALGFPVFSLRARKNKRYSTKNSPGSFEIHHDQPVPCQVDLLLKLAVFFNNNRISLTNGSHVERRASVYMIM